MIPIYHHRNQLPILLNLWGLTDSLVEVGVWKAANAKSLRRLWNGKTLYLVDPWKSFDYSEYPEHKGAIEQKEFDNIYKEVKAWANSTEGVVVRRQTSVNAAKKFKNNSLDCVYIDANHTEKYVTQDINAWWPKVKPGGILSGHDYTNRGDWCHVQTVVDRFVKENDLQLMLFRCQHGFHSWAVRKPA